MSTEERISLYKHFKQTFGDLSEKGLYRIGRKIVFDLTSSEKTYRVNDREMKTYIYHIDDKTSLPLEIAGKVIWKYHHKEKGLVYIVKTDDDDDDDASLVEVSQSELIIKKVKNYAIHDCSPPIPGTHYTLDWATIIEAWIEPSENDIDYIVTVEWERHNLLFEGPQETTYIVTIENGDVEIVRDEP